MKAPAPVQTASKHPLGSTPSPQGGLCTDRRWRFTPATVTIDIMPGVDERHRQLIWVIQVLIDHLGSNIVSRLAGAQDHLDAYLWPEPGSPGPDASQAARVRVAYDVWTIIAPDHGDDIVVDWLLTPNLLVGTCPADALAAGDFFGVLHAAHRFT